MSENIKFWENILRESSKRTKQCSTSVLFIGNSNSGKTSIIKQFCEKDKTNSVGRETCEIISYDYFNISDLGFEDDHQSVEISGRVNVWAMSDNSFDNYADIVLDPIRAEKVCKSCISFL
jgi:GTPase SAR1 family protein